MEIYTYRCAICGFIHQVPAYWVSFSPEYQITFEHISFLDNESCQNSLLDLCSESPF